MVVATGLGLIYYRGDRNLTAAVVAGMIAGLVILPIEVRNMTNPEQATERALTGFPYFETALAIGGIALVILGAIIAEPAVAVSGLPFLGIAIAFLAIKQRLRRLRSRP